jgi:ubiquinone biosynthesis protein UbiJ
MLVEGPVVSLEALLNRQIEASTPARERLARLTGRSFAVAVAGPADRSLRLRVEAAREGLRLSLGEAPADANVRGSALSLLRLLSGRENGGHHQPGVTVEGDATVVQGFEQLFRHAKPDVEAELARLLGPTGAHYAFGAAKATFEAGARLWHTLTRSAGDYLVEESRDVVSRHELEAFHQDVEGLRDDVERLAARLDRLNRISERSL